MEMIPRSTRSQKMDALSSQANLAGYVAVTLAANHMPRIMPMMMTPAWHVEARQGFYHWRRRGRACKPSQLPSA
jgi:NAD/NADP transhydrogenase alpha subunit